MKTFKEIDIKYYDNSGNVQVRCTIPVTQDALVHYELMQSHYCKLSFKLSRPTYFLLGDFIETPYGRFELIDLTKTKDNDTIGYSYEIQFDAYYRKLKNKILKYRPNTGSQEATFSLTSKISTQIEVIMKNLAYYAKLDKSYLYDPNFEGEGTDYTYVIDASVDANAAKLITYSNSSILDAIANIAQTFGCEWWFEGNILHFGTCENTNAITDFRLNDNIVSMSSSQSQSTYANRVYAFGAARNLPSRYKNDSDADITKDGVVEKRLMLPTSAECSEQNKQMLAENGFELKNGYIQVGGLREDQYVEGVTTNDDIYPRNLIKTSKVTSYEKDVEDESTPEEGDYIKRTFYRVNSLTIVNDDGEKTGDMAFRKAYILSGKNLHIVFQSGSLNGMDFECEFNPDGVPEILLDDDGNPIFKDGKEQINPKSQVFEIVANEDYGRFLPDITLHPKDGDTFVLYNWDSTKLGDTLVSSASNELLTDAIKDLKKSVIDPTTYTCTAEANYSYNHGRGNLHGVGDRVNLYNKGYGDSYRASRIIGYEFSLDIPFDGAKYYVGEKPSYSRLNAMESKIEELIYNGQSYLNGNGGSGRSIYIIKSYDSITPTDYNVFSAKAVDEQRLNKTKDDTAKGTITWEKIQKFLQGLTAEDLSQFKKGATFGEFIQGMLFGTGGRIDELGNAEFESITSRSSIIAKELITNRQTAMESNFVFTESGLVETVTEIPATTEDGNVTYDLKLQKRWDNDFTAFKENDVVLASINTLAESGKYYDMWLRVLSVNTVTNTITVVCYPDNECPSKKNYPPCELARLIRWGNAVDEDRQSCWYISSSEGLLVWMDHVTKPIIDKTNYSLAMGKLPDALSFLFQDFPTANKRDGAFYAKWMMAASFQQIDYQGNPIYTTRDRGVWSLAVAQGDNPYRNGDRTIDTVYYLGCKWQCLEDKTTKPPTYSSTAWAFVEGNPYFTLEMLSSKLWNFRLNDLMATNADGSWKVFATLSVVGRLYNQDVTDSMTNVVWTRETNNPTADNKWALSHANCGLSVDLTYEDLGGAAFKIGSVTFRCNAEIKDGETMYSEDVSVSF
jgi:hypothetical protein